MNFIEKYRNDISNKKKELEDIKARIRMVDYYQKMLFWHNATLEWLNNPIEMPLDNGETMTFNFSQESAEKKSKTNRMDSK